MLRIVLIRPGCTDYVDQGRIQGTLDIPLNETGSTEVARLIDELRSWNLEALYVPECEPAQETAAAIADALGMKLRKMERMQNLNHGLWQGKLIDDLRRTQPRVYRQWQENPDSICPPDGEMLAEAEERIRTAISKLLKRHKEGTIGLVLPEPLATLVRRYLTHAELGDLWKASGAHANWEIIEVEPRVPARSG